MASTKTPKESLGQANRLSLHPQVEDISNNYHTLFLLCADTVCELGWL